MLFVNAIDSTRPVQTMHPPLGIGYLVSALREWVGPDTFEFRVLNGPTDLGKEIHAFDPDIIGISSVSQNFNRAQRYAAIAKMSGKPVIVGGIHISMLPQSLSRDMDVGVIGEGEETIRELMDLYLTQGGFHPKFLAKVKGITYWENGHRIQTAPRPPVKSLDNLPHPARDLFPDEPTAYMFTARGCPYRCTFCASSRFWGAVRTFSPEYIVSEVEDLVHNHGVKMVCLYDDIFPLSRTRVQTVIQLLRERRLLGAVQFFCAVRANMVTDQLISLLKEMGVVTIGIGMESANDSVLRYLKGPHFTRQDNINAIQRVRRQGLEVHSSFIIGSPKETKREAKRTLAFIRKYRLVADLYLLTPFPGTPIWEYAEQRGLVSSRMDWRQLDVERDKRPSFRFWAYGPLADFQDPPCDPIILSETMTRAEISALFSRFKSLHRRRGFYNKVRAGLRHPLKAMHYLAREMGGDSLRQ